MIRVRVLEAELSCHDLGGDRRRYARSERCGVSRGLADCCSGADSAPHRRDHLQESIAIYGYFSLRGLCRKPEEYECLLISCRSCVHSAVHVERRYCRCALLLDRAPVEMTARPSGGRRGRPACEISGSSCGMNVNLGPVDPRPRRSSIGRSPLRPCACSGAGGAGTRCR